MARPSIDHETALRRLLDAALTGGTTAVVDVVTDDVVGWSPHLLVTSRAELIEVLEGRERAFSNIDAQIDTLDQVGNRAIAEWHLSLDHTGPVEIDEDLVIEATGRRLHLAGATFADFDGDRIRAFRHYFDDLALLEQMLVED